MLVAVAATFSDENTKAAYDDLQAKLAADYGPMPTPKTVDGRLTSEKIIGRLGVHHRISKFLFVPVEQLVFYRTGQ
jgi:hypothetical protein